MKKYFVTYDQSVELKELGFNERCLGNYISPDNLITEFEMENTPKHYLGFPAPLKSQILDWFGDKYNLHCDILTDSTMEPKFCFQIKKFVANPNDLTSEEWGWDDQFTIYSDLYYTRSESISAAINKLIEIVKNK